MTPAQNFAVNLGAVLALAVAMAYVGPTLDDVSPQAQQASDEEKQSQRFTRAVKEMCGPNAGWREQEDGSIRCYLHTGKKTSTVFQVSAL